MNDSAEVLRDHLKRLQDEDALEEGQAQRHDPLDGLFPAVLKAIQQGEVSGDGAEGQQEEPAQEHTPPGQPAARRALLSLDWRRAGGGEGRGEDSQ